MRFPWLRGSARLLPRPRAIAPAAALALASALLLVAPSVRADDVDLARKHFAEGVKRYREGDYEGARALFKQADAAHHAPAIVYNIARAEERLGHPQAAIDAYEAYLGEAGEKGEFTQAAIVAIAQIRASARQLRIETKPPGARVFIDGSPARDVAPTRVLVPAGRHHVVAEGDGWRAEADVDTGASSVETVTLVQPEATPPVASLNPATTLPPSGGAGAVRAAGAGSGPAPTESSSSSPPPPLASDGFIFGAQFVIVPHRFAERPQKDFSSWGLAAGLQVEAGFAPSEEFVVLGRAMVAVGSKGTPATSIVNVGLALSYHVTRALWIGAAFQGGRALLPGAINPVGSEQLRFDTDYVFCPTLELSYAVLTRPYGQWLVSVYPGYYFTSPSDNDVFFVPVGFGLRTF